MIRKLLAFVCLLPLAAFAQSPARIDQPITTMPAQVPVGSLPNVLAVTNATVSICGFPATMSGGMCTNTITTYTDSTLSTACPSTAQMTPQGSNQCIPTTALNGNLGFWYDAAVQTHMTYTVRAKWGTFGPFDISQPIGTGTAANPAGQPGQKQINGGGAFGVIPNTFVANTSGVQACINAAGNNGVCELPPNFAQTLTTPLTISLSNFTLQCDTGATLSTSGIDAIHVTGGSNIAISGCTLNGQNTGTANGITIMGTSGITINGGNLIENFGGMGIYTSAGWSNLVVQNNTLIGNTSDGVFGTNGTGGRVLNNKIIGLSSTFHHLVAFHGSDSADAGTVTAVCTVQSANLVSITGSGTLATVTVSGAVPANIGSNGVAKITGSADYDGFYLATVTGASTFTFSSTVTASDGAAGTASSGGVSSLTIGATGANYAPTGTLQFFNGQITAGTITANIPTGTFASTSGHLSSVAVTNPGYCNSNPPVHANNLDTVNNIEVAGNEFHSGSSFAIEVGSFSGQAGTGVNIHDNSDTEDVNVSGYGGYSVDTAINVKFNNNKFTTTQATAPNLACIEMVNVVGGTVTNNTCVGQGLSINKSSYSSVIGNSMTGLYASQFGIYNGTSDFNENQNNNNTLTGNIINFQPGVSGTGIETQCNTVNGIASNTVVANNTISAPSGLSSGNAIVFSNNGLGCTLANSQTIGNIIGPWRHAYSISTSASGALNLDQSTAADQGTISNFVPFFSIANQTGVHTIAFDGTSASAISALYTLSMVSESVGGVFNVAPSSGFSAELMQATIDNLVIQAGNAGNPRTIFFCGSSDTATTNCPSFFNDGFAIPAGNINMAANGTNGYCFTGTGSCFTWNATLSAVKNNFPLEAQNNVYILQSASGFWNRFTQLNTLTANQSINIPNANSATAPSQAVVAGICLTGFSSTTASWSTGTCGGSGSGSVTSFAAPSGSWPTWLVPTVTNSTTTPSLAVAAGIVPVANGGTGTATPGLVAGTNVTITGSWPNQTINSSGGGSAPTLQTNTVNNTSQAALNLLNSSTNAAGLTATFANTSAGNVQMEIAGTISAAHVATLNQNTTGTAANLSGTPALPSGTTATTQTAGDNTTKLATDAFVLANAAGISGLTSGKVPVATSGTAIGNSHIDDGLTTAATVTISEPLVVNTGGSVNSTQIGTNLFSALPACAGGTEGTMAPVTDSTTNTWGATITGSGADHVLAYCDGTAWTVAAK
jgi:Right handed beta helix region